LPRQGIKMAIYQVYRRKFCPIRLRIDGQMVKICINWLKLPILNIKNDSGRQKQVP
jgi:hypothetical protein